MTAERTLDPTIDYLDPELAARIFEASAPERPACDFRMSGAECPRLAEWRATSLPCRCTTVHLCTEHADAVRFEERAVLDEGGDWVCMTCGKSSPDTEWQRIA